MKTQKQKQIICHYVMGLESLVKICCRWHEI